MVEQQSIYEKLVDEMNDITFSFCVDQLLPISDFKLMKKEDIRPIDLKEWLIRFGYSISKAEKRNDLLDTGFYIDILKKYFDTFVKCKTGSRAERYHVRAMELMKVSCSKEGSLEDIEDLVLIFVSFFRALRPYFDTINTQGRIIKNLEFDVYQEDTILLKDIKCKLMPNGMSTNPIKAKNLNEWSKMIDASEFAYVNNMLFLCRALQNRGVFTKEEV